jgi:cell division protein FtsW (lipid II flippase)
MSTVLIYLLVTVVSFIAVAFANKLINDNLPDLRFKKIVKALKRYWLVASLCFSYLIIKIKRDKELEKIFIYTLIAITIVVIAYRFINHQMKKENKKKLNCSG